MTGCGEPAGFGLSYPPPMPSNVEIKARVRHRSELEDRVRALADHGPELIVQHDVFYHCEAGRLKLRTFDDGSGELIFYRRSDAEGPTESEFRKFSTPDPEALRGILAASLGTVGEVRKRRTLYRVGQTRVHLDAVEGLGDFLELEVVLRDDETVENGAAIARDLMAVLGIVEDDLEARAYVDLL